MRNQARRRGRLVSRLPASLAVLRRNESRANRLELFDIGASSDSGFRNNGNVNATLNSNLNATLNASEASLKFVKRFAIALFVYIGIVAAFESLIGFFQPAGGTTLVITTGGGDGSASDRVLSRLESGDQLYVAANHWPRAWYNEALRNPKVDVTIDGKKGAYLAVPVTGAEHTRIGTEHDTGVLFRILTGFPPRYFLRLDPR